MNLLTLIKKGELSKQVMATQATMATSARIQHQDVAKVATVSTTKITPNQICSADNIKKINYNIKQTLGPRIQILRVLIRRNLNHIRAQDTTTQTKMLINDKFVEFVVDHELSAHNYDLEAAIDSCREFAPKPEPTCKCGYQPPFCSCGGILMSEVVTCNSCKHFTPDKVGDGAGIGNCRHGIESTQELSGRMPLYRYSIRRCAKFNIK